MSNDIFVRCPECSDEFHTKEVVGSAEGCTVCDSVFIIQEEDVTC